MARGIKAVELSLMSCTFACISQWPENFNRYHCVKLGHLPSAPVRVQMEDFAPTIKICT